jgi:hypothetical protein
MTMARQKTMQQLDILDMTKDMHTTNAIVRQTRYDAKHGWSPHEMPKYATNRIQLITMK